MGGVFGEVERVGVVDACAGGGVVVPAGVSYVWVAFGAGGVADVRFRV